MEDLVKKNHRIQKKLNDFVSDPKSKKIILWAF
jgi:hypothetical protein